MIVISLKRTLNAFGSISHHFGETLPSPMEVARCSQCQPGVAICLNEVRVQPKGLLGMTCSVASMMIQANETSCFDRTMPESMMRTALRQCNGRY